MGFTAQQIRRYFFYLWLVLAIGLLFFLLNQNIKLGSRWSYDLDLSQANTRDWYGPYPETRTTYIEDTKYLQVLAEPLYWQIYLPKKYKAVLWRSKIININQQPVSIGLKQKDGSWEMQEVEAEQFTLEFSLKNALIKNNRLEFIMSLPEISSDKQIFIENINLEFNK
ncbi:MAG: hypothetical protein UR94_C0033G0019 [Parcubacteria group bacterium GW2011_GWA2_36_10]|nr:MAG: hypothetical protein UR94_C0033G0019 [Parcubacteria group bacterium GW2011_GWA2_36_10]